MFLWFVTMGNKRDYGAPGEIRTPDRLVRSRTVESLQVAAKQDKARHLIPDYQLTNRRQIIDSACPVAPLLGVAQ